MNNIKELRNFLGDAMKDLKEGKLSVEKAKTISDLGQVIVNSAKVEVDFIKAAKIKNATDFISDGIVKSLKESRVEDVEKEKPTERPRAEYDNKGHLHAIEKYGTNE